MVKTWLAFIIWIITVVAIIFIAFESLDQMMEIDEYNFMLFHYVTITGIIIDTNIPESRYTYNDCVLSDNLGVYFRIQTWGEEYYIKYSDFIGYNESNMSSYGYVIVVN